MKHLVTPKHHGHLHSIGIEKAHDLFLAKVDDEQYQKALGMWKRTLPNATEEELHVRALANLLWRQQNKAEPKPAVKKVRYNWFLLGIIVALLLLLYFVWPSKAHAQFSHISTIQVSDGVNNFFTAAPFDVLFSGCSVTPSGSTVTVTCSGAAANPGGVANQLQYNSAGTAFAGISFGASGQVLESCGTNCLPQFQDPIVSGPTANGVAPSATNPVWVAGWDATNIHALLTDASGRLAVNVNGTVPVSGTFWQATQPVSGTFWQATQPVSGTVSATQGTSPWVDSITTWGGGTLGAMATYGTSPGAVLVPGVNSFITNVPHFVCDSGCASGGSSTPADTFSNPTTAGLGMSFPMLWNGTTWDRQYGDKTNGAFVNVKTSVLPTGAALDSSLTTLDTDLKANVTLHAGTNVIGHVIVDSGAVNATLGAETTKVIGTVNQGTSPWVTSSTLAAETTKVIGTVNQGTSPWVASATLAAETTKVIGTARVVGNTGAAVDAATNGAIPTNQVWTVPTASPAAGAALAACNIVSAASTNATLCKNATGNFFGFEIFNTTTTVYYLRLYNLTTAPTCSSATGFIRSIPIPPASAAGQVGGAVSNQTYPTPYGTGISYCITGGSAGTDNTNAAVGIFGEIRYE